jgi:hypothetical protein
MTSFSTQKFFPNPFGEGYVYRTGDIVSRLKVRELRVSTGGVEGEE